MRLAAVALISGLAFKPGKARGVPVISTTSQRGLTVSLLLYISSKLGPVHKLTPYQNCPPNIPNASWYFVQVRWNTTSLFWLFDKVPCSGSISVPPINRCGTIRARYEHQHPILSVACWMEVHAPRRVRAHSPAFYRYLCRTRYNIVYGALDSIQIEGGACGAYKSNE